MFDNLRDLSDSPLYEEDQNQDDDLFKDIEEEETPTPAPVRKKRRNKNFLGMTAQQRFLISIMLMIMVCMLGTLAMFALGRMSIF